jgi:hypothetical protein
MALNDVVKIRRYALRSAIGLRPTHRHADSGSSNDELRKLRECIET